MIKKYTTIVGGGYTTYHNIHHNLGTVDVIVAVYYTGPMRRQYKKAEITIISEDTVELAFADVPASMQWKVVIIG